VFHYVKQPTSLSTYCQYVGHIDFKTESCDCQSVTALSQRLPGREWQKYPDHNQEKFQSLMLSRARAILKLADLAYEDDSWEKKKA
jgi:hypothetical protein